MDDVVALPPTRYAELVAPAVSRAFVSGMQPDRRLRRVVEDHGGADVGFMIDLCNPLAAGRVVSRADLGNLYRYSDPDEIETTMARTIESGLLSEQPGDGYLNRLSWLRCHRADAHASAWAAAGMTAAQVRAEPWGAPWSERRREVERRTNEVAGQPFGALDATERLQLLADLAALP